MKLYSLKNAPNPRRVRIFLAEKRVSIPIEEIEDVETGLHRKPEFRAKNSLAQLPVLELDDGTTLTESVAICRYFEETVPEPPLFGRSTIERATLVSVSLRISRLLSSQRASCNCARMLA